MLNYNTYMLPPAAKIEAFHLTFLQAFANSVPATNYAIKGGCNLRYFFGSQRYSEDLDLDVCDIPVHQLREKVMSILESGSLNTTARTYDVARVRPAKMLKAKQTETVQRFKVHLESTAGENLPTKIEFSLRGMDHPITTGPVVPEVLAAYRMPSLILPHYTADAAVLQKIRALAGRALPQARDIFDLHLLSTQPEVSELDLKSAISRAQLETALANTYSVDYEQYRDTVVSFLSPQSQERYGSRGMWDDIRLVTITLIEQRFLGGR